MVYIPSYLRADIALGHCTRAQALQEVHNQEHRYYLWKLEQDKKKRESKGKENGTNEGV